MADFKWYKFDKEKEDMWPFYGEDLIVASNSICQSRQFSHAIFWISPYPHFSIFDPEFTESMVKYYAYIPEIK